MMRVLKLGILTLLILLTGCNINKEINNKEIVKTNTNQNVIKEQKLEVFKFTNTSLVYKDGFSIFETTVTNTSSNAEYLDEFKIHVRDSEGLEIITLISSFKDFIGPDETKTITATYGDDLTEAFSVDYELKR